MRHSMCVDVNLQESIRPSTWAPAASESNSGHRGLITGAFVCPVIITAAQMESDEGDCNISGSIQWLICRVSEGMLWKVSHVFLFPSDN